MISDKERREVAARLRVYSHDFDFDDSNQFWYVAKAAFGDVDVHTYYSVFALLADLIDPTCNMEPECEGFRCSACGTYHDMSGFEEFPWPRCPECGARVVRGDE